MKRKNVKTLFFLVALFGVLGVALTLVLLYLEIMDPEIEVTRNTLILNLFLAGISMIVSLIYLILGFVKEEKLYNHLGLMRLLTLFCIFGNLISLILACILLNSLKMNALIEKGFNPNAFYMNFVNAQEQNEYPQDEEKVVEAEVQETPIKDTKTMQEQLDELNVLLDNNKISEEEYYRRRQEILNRYYGNN